MSFPRLRIAIIGAGPGGLALGALLHKRGLPFTIFELRQKPTEAELAEPAGSLDLHEGSGLAVIRELGLFDSFKELTDDCSSVQKVADKDGNILHVLDLDETDGPPRPEISRNKLAQLLWSGIPNSAIRWQHKLITARKYTASGGGTEVEVDFGDHGKHTFDLVIGADGAWSRVRPLVTDAKPKYTGHQHITTHLRQISTKYPQLAELVGTGTFFSLGDRHGIISQRAAQDTARLYTIISTEDEHFASTNHIKDKSAAHVKPILFDGDQAPLKRYGSVIRNLVGAACDDEAAFNPHALVDIRPLYTLYTSSEGLNWQHKSGATLIGDAAHLMPPNGEGVNSAMLDALQLSNVIAQACELAEQKASTVQDILDPLIEEFEKDMFERAKVIVGETDDLEEILYGSDNGAQVLADFFKGAVAASVKEP